MSGRRCRNESITGAKENAIDTIIASKKRFVKREKLKADQVRRFQKVEGFPSDGTMEFPCITNGIKRNPITKRDVQLAR